MYNHNEESILKAIGIRHDVLVAKMVKMQMETKDFCFSQLVEYLHKNLAESQEMRKVVCYWAAQILTPMINEANELIFNGLEVGDDEKIGNGD